MRRIGLRPVTLALSLIGCLAGTAASAEVKRLFAVPPRQWDNAMTRDRVARFPGPTDLANLTGGILFGLSPLEVNAKLTTPLPSIDWESLPFANEYPDDVRYFWVRLDTAPELRAGIKGCAGANSYVVFLFRNRNLFRISWRLLPDNDCPSPRAAAEDVYARYLAIDRSVALTVHYHAGKAEAVEITDPNADYLVPYRWSNRQRR